jgi:predicted permease
MTLHPLFASLIQDSRYALRLLRRQPGYAALAILTMALGIGATTTLFSVAYGVLLKPLPWPGADRIARVTEARGGKQGRIRGTVTNGTYLAWQDQPATIEALGGYSIVPGSATLRAAGRQEPVRVQFGRLTPSMFDVLKASPVRGRAFEPADAAIGSGAYPDARVIILSYGLWQEWFAGRDDAIGSAAHVDDRPVTIVGVMPRGFAFPDRDTRAWLPMPIGSVVGENNVRRMMIFGALARVRPDHTFAQAAAEATGRARSAPDPGMAAVSLFGSSEPPEVALTSAAAAMTADVRPGITLLLAAVALLLATAVANVGGLQLARATTRRRELAIRAAIGAGSGRLARQLVVESTLLAAAGGGAGLLLTAALHRVLPSLLPADFPRLESVSIDATVFAFVCALTIAVGVACGLLPAFQVRRAALTASLSEANSDTSSGGGRLRAVRLRAIVMATQVAAACVLLVGAALLARSFVAMMRADRGYDPINVLTARVDLGAAYDGPRRAAFADAVSARLRGVAGVSHAAAGNALPFVTSGGTLGFSLPSPSRPDIKQDVQALTRYVAPEYFATLRLRLVEGRTLTDRDTPASRPVAVVNRTFARRYLGTPLIGTRLPIYFGDNRRDCDVVGVVEDMRQSGVTDPDVAEVFMSYRQMPARLVNGPLFVVARTAGDPTPLAPMLREAIQEQDPTVALDTIATMEERVMSSLAKPRLYALLLGAFGTFAVFIAGVGLFGVLAYSVAQRQREIGVRTALGARTRDIVILVLWQAAGVAVAGLSAGLTASFALSGLLSTFLYGVAPRDAVSFAAVAAVLMLVTAVACVVPARRAARVDPLTVLKSS